MPELTAGEAPLWATVIACNEAIGACQRLSQWQGALQVLRRLRVQRFRPNAVTFNTSLSACGRALFWGQALHLFQAATSWNAITFGAAINACSGSWPRAQCLLRQAGQSNIITCSSCVSACEKASDWPEALLLLAGLGLRRLQGDVVVCNAAISACQKVGAWPRALDIFSKLQLASTVSFNAAISACEGVGEWQQALALLRLAQPDTITYNSTICTFREREKWQLALALLKELGQQADAASCTAVLSVFDKAGQWRRVLQLLEDMAGGVRFNQIIYNAAMSACEKAAKWQTALLLLRRLVASRMVDVISFNAAISACARVGQWTTATHLLAEMMEMQVQATEISFSACISCFVRAAQWQRSLCLLQEMRTQKLSSIVAINAAVSSLGHWELAMKMLSSMRAELLEMDVITFNAAVSVCQKAAQWQAAWAIFAETSGGLQPSIVTANALVSSCEQYGRWQQAHWIVHATSLRPDIITFNAACSASEKASCWRLAICCLDEVAAMELEANVITLTSAIAAAANSLAWLQVLSLLRDASARPTEDISPELLATCSYLSAPLLAQLEQNTMAELSQSFGKRTQSAVGSLHVAGAYSTAEMLAARLAPGVDSFCTLIQAQASGGHWQRVLSLLEAGGEEWRATSAIKDLFLGDGPEESGPERRGARCSGGHTQCCGRACSVHCQTGTPDAESVEARVAGQARTGKSSTEESKTHVQCCVFRRAWVDVLTLLGPSLVAF
ncbi:unnamed protein product [Effrenium voratum]|nr:unnamed protein product [Effrenium voratum]